MNIQSTFFILAVLSLLGIAWMFYDMHQFELAHGCLPIYCIMHDVPLNR